MLPNPFNKPLTPPSQTDPRLNTDLVRRFAGDAAAAHYAALVKNEGNEGTGTNRRTPAVSAADLAARARAQLAGLKQSAVEAVMGQFFTESIPAQYEKQIASLTALGLLSTTVPSKKGGFFSRTKESKEDTLGLTAIDTKFYPVPTREAITQHFTSPERIEFFKTKIEQGFTKLEITPLGLPLTTFEKQMKATILEHHAGNSNPASKKKLMDKEGNPPFNRDATTGKLQTLDTTDPLKDWGNGAQAEAAGTLIYFPKQFTATDHGGMTKQQLLTDPSQPFPGYLVRFVQPDNTIPRAGAAQPPKNGRQDMEAGKSPNDYLTLLQSPTTPEDPTTANPYHNEQGYTLEQTYTRFLTTLHETNTVLDDWEYNGTKPRDSASYCLANFDTASGYVPDSRWYRSGRLAYVAGDDPSYASVRYGARVAVG